MRRKPRQPRQDTESRKERPGMEGTQFLYCETRKGSPRVNIEVCLTKCKKTAKCKPLKDYQATNQLEHISEAEKIERDLSDPAEKFFKKLDTDPTPGDDLEQFIDNELDKERRADPNHPINRRGNKQLDLFNFIEREAE